MHHLKKTYQCQIHHLNKLQQTLQLQEEENAKPTTIFLLF